MPEWVDLLDGANQKYDPSGSSLSSTNVQAAIDELDAKPAPPTDLTDAEFPTYAVFASRIDAASATVDFASGNKQQIDAATYAIITVTAPAGHPANFVLRILNSGSLASIGPATGNIRWGNNTPPTWTGTSTLYLYYDGTDWEGSVNLGLGAA